MAGTYKGILTVSTAVATTEVQVTGVGFRPKALILYGVHFAGTGYGRSNVWGSFGVVDQDLNQYCYAGYVEDNADPSNTSQWMSDFECCGRLDNTTWADSLKVISLDDDGFTYEIVNQYATAYVYQFLAINCAASACGTFSPPTSTGNDAVTGAGMKGSALLLFGGTPAVVATNTKYDAFAMNLGCATATDERWTCGRYLGDSLDPQDEYTTNTDDRCYQHYTDTEADFISFDVDGFTLNWIDASGAGTELIVYLLLSGGEYFAGSLLGTGTTGTNAETGVGFEPTGLLLGSSRQIDLGAGVAKVTSYGADNPATFVLGMGDTDLNQSEMGHQGTDGLTGGTRSAAFYYDDDIYRGYSGANPPVYVAEAELDSMDSDGFTLDWIDAEGATIMLNYFAMRPLSAGNRAFIIS